MSQLIKITNQGMGLILLGEEFIGSKPIAQLRPGQTTIIRLGTPIRAEGADIKIKVEEISDQV